MKKTIGLMVAMVMLMGCMLNSVALAEGSCRLAVTAGEVSQGELSVTVAITENPGIASLIFTLKFDNTKLVLKSASAVQSTLGTAVQLNTDQPGLDLGSQSEVSFSWYDANAVNRTGNLINLKVELRDGTWSETILALDNVEAFDGDPKEISVSTSGATVINPVSVHTHTPGTEWLHDETQHWHACTGENCNEKLDLAIHTWNEGVVTTQPNETEGGVKTLTCSFCDRTKTEKVPATGDNTTYIPFNGYITTTPVANITGTAPQPPQTGSQDSNLGFCLLILAAATSFYAARRMKKSSEL